MSNFGLIVSGRLVTTDFQPVDTNKFLTTIPNADSINHIVVFLTGTSPLRSDLGASVYFSWPDPSNPPVWQYLGFISNDKPSTIFRVTKLRSANNNIDTFASSYNGFSFNQPLVPHHAQIGISIEPLSQIQQMIPDLGVNPLNTESIQKLASNTAQNLLNYAASFAQTLTSSSNDQYVSLSVIYQWYQNFTRKLEQNPNFWKQ